jgi:CBS domain-containing protein
MMTIARNLMTSEILMVAEDMTLKELADFLVDHEISGAVVCNEHGKPSGVVSLTDIAAAAAQGGSQYGVRRSGFYDLGWDDSANDGYTDEWDSMTIRVPEGELVIRDIMSTKIVTVTPETPIAEVAQTLLSNHIHRVLVEEQAELIGIITTSDLLRQIAAVPVAG